MDRTGKKRLDSWKQIAEYLRRDVTTVCRWEKEKGLPVHRLPGGARQAVFAYEEEIDSWLSRDMSESSRPALLPDVHPPPNISTGPTALQIPTILVSDAQQVRQFSATDRSSWKFWKRTPIVFATVVILTGLAVIARFSRGRGAPEGTDRRGVQVQSPPTSKYDFEDGEQGWIAKPRTMVSRVSSSDVHFFEGRRSLAIVFGGPYTRKSQAYVLNPPLEAGRTVSAYLRCPAKTDLSYIALFVEDREFTWSNDYRPITYLIPGGWTKLSVRVPADARMPIARIGLEFTAEAPWQGTCFLDSVDW